MLWVFGDSYSMTWDHVPSTWISQLKNHLNVGIVNFSTGGSSLGYTYEKFNEHRSDINDDDIVIIVATDLDRQNFFPTNHGLSSPSNLTSVNSPSMVAYQQYFDHLNNQSNNEINFINFLYNVKSVKDSKNIKILVISGFYNTCLLIDKIKNNFPGLLFSLGYLTNISISEIDEPIFLSILKTVDPRYNHLCLSNHSILTEKIINSLESNTDVDLTSGFAKCLINQNMDRHECNEISWDKIINNLCN